MHRDPTTQSIQDTGMNCSLQYTSAQKKQQDT